MLRRLRRLGYIDGSNVLLPKGRVACCIDGADELLTTELLVGGGLATELSTAEVAALASCLLQGDKPPPPVDAGTAGTDAPPAVRGSPALVRAVRALWDARAVLAREPALGAGAPGSVEAAATSALAAAGEMVVVAGEAGPALRVDLMAAVHAWVEGQSFASAWALCDGEVFEGELVRQRGNHRIYVTYTARHARVHTEGPTVRTARVPPLAFTLNPQVRSLRQLDELMRQLVKVAPRVEIALLLAPQLATLAAWGWLFL